MQLDPAPEWGSCHLVEMPEVPVRQAGPEITGNMVPHVSTGLTLRGTWGDPSVISPHMLLFQLWVNKSESESHMK